MKSEGWRPIGGGYPMCCRDAMLVMPHVHDPWVSSSARQGVGAYLGPWLMMQEPNVLLHGYLNESIFDTE